MDWNLRTIVLAASPAIAFLAYKTTGALLHSFLKSKMTVIGELPNLGKARPDGERIRGTAVICGGSISGLWAARICADHFEDVLIIDPEAWLATEEGRTSVYDSKGELIDSGPRHERARVQQYKSLHVFLLLILKAAKAVIPGFEENIIAADARIRFANVNAHAFGGRILASPDTSEVGVPEIFYCTRETFERVLRGSILKAFPRIRWLVGTVTGLEPKGGDFEELQGVVVRMGDGQTETIDASLVVDCSGGSQAGLNWLKRLHARAVESDPKKYTKVPRGCLPFDSLRVGYDAHSYFANFRFYIPPEMRNRLPIPGGYDDACWLYSFFPIPGVQNIYFMVNRLEGHRIEIQFGCWGNHHLPEDSSEIRDFLRTVISPTDPAYPDWMDSFLHILLEDREIQKPIKGRYPHLSKIKYERAPFMPSNFVAIGDATMQVNPVYGQGCTKALVGAVNLDSSLRKLAYGTSIPRTFSSSFFQTHHDRTSATWDGTKPTDYLWKSTTPVKGEKLSDESAMGNFGRLLLELTSKDRSVDIVVWHVRCFIWPPTELLRPSILLKVLLLGIKRAFTGY